MPRKSSGNYPADWNDIALQVKQDAGWRCVRCGHPHDPQNGYTLTVHHLDMDPSNCRWWNLPPLCQRCHLQIQQKVVMEQPYMFEHSIWFRPYVAGFYAYINGCDDSQEHVMANIETLLDYGKP